MNSLNMNISLSFKSVISYGRNVLEQTLFSPKFLGNSGAFLLTDENVFSLYSDLFQKPLKEFPIFVMGAGEANKSAQTLFSLLESMARANLRRDAKLIAVGGGVVCDLGGLAASLYMRGIPSVLVPTTLLAQVDASLGGKTAVNFLGVKNLLGSFHFPEKILVDYRFLLTLPPRELRCGLGEIIKHGALHPALFQKLWENRSKLFDLDFLTELIPQNLAFKTSIVMADCLDSNTRVCLNLGHTTAHAIESADKGLSHGECVLIGLILESCLAERYCACDTDFLKDLRTLCLSALGSFPQFDDPGELLKSASMDKKNSSEKISLIVPVELGKYQRLELDFESYLREMRKIKLC